MTVTHKILFCLNTSKLRVSAKQEEKLENGDKGGNGGIPTEVVEKEHEEEMKEGEIEIEEKKQGTKKRRRDRRTTAKRKKAEKDPST